ncbi:4Fe-4S single cluster domain [Pseudobutyrivibrio ruminis]|uniref:4Fe-4S single cluster domain n=1 Tax=Pseudobutyrivibrio ruminis TaxID=46206 RepID=A0A1H7K7Q2_9FIRM|nr:hypothetical protein [Pseudobutyrivibrio ruminis]SEK82913.1 4Fe-4S single cluster domain [Pseudobutyrivibrio ruminis]
MVKIALYGAGNLGKYVLSELEKQNLYEPIIFIDNFVSGQSWSRRGLKIVNLEIFKKEWEAECDAVIICAENKINKQSMTLSLLPWFNKDIFLPSEHILSAKLPLFNEKGDFCTYVKKYTEEKPILSYVEHDLTKFCNLKCKNCGHRSDEVKSIIKSDRKVFIQSLEGLRKIFSNIYQIRLMGGEPFVLDDLDWYVDTARGFFEESEIDIVTNGLLIPNVNEEILLAIKKNNINVQISQYPPTRKMIEKIVYKLEQAGVKYQISSPILKFMERRENYEYVNKIESIYRNCPNYHCHTMSDGRLFGCGIIKELIERDGDKVNNKLLLENSIDLINPKISGWDALILLERANTLCGYCFEEQNWVNWESLNKNYNLYYKQ